MDKLIHLLGSLLLTAGIYTGLGVTNPGLSAQTKAAIAITATAAIGIGKELIDDRISKGDLMADATGIAMGIILVW